MGLFVCWLWSRYRIIGYNFVKILTNKKLNGSYVGIFSMIHKTTGNELAIIGVLENSMSKSFEFQQILILRR